MTRLIALVFLCAGQLAGAAAAQCITNEWIGEDADWSHAPSWSRAGEPTAEECAVIADGVLVQVTQAGETCAELTVGGPEDPTTTVQLLPGGVLSVAGAMTLGDGGIGIFTQLHGACTTGSLEIAIGGYTMGAGTFTTGSMFVATGAVVSSFNPIGGLTTVTGNMQLGPLGIVVVSSGRLEVGGTLIVGGRFTVSGGTSPNIDAAALSVVSGGTIAPDVNAFGLTAITVSGVAELGGTLSVGDFNAADGTYTVITAGSLEGAFDFVQLPSDDWSWGIEGNTVWVKKEDQTPVQMTTWGDIKARF